MDERKKVLVHNIGAFTLMFMVSLVVFFLASNKMENRNYINMSDYNHELATTTADKTAAILKGNVSTIKIYANSYQVSSRGADYDATTLASISDDSPFDFVDYISEDGKEYSSNGKTTDVSKESFFKKAMKGYSGIVGLMSSEVSEGKLIGFYAPVKVDGMVRGVLIGYMSENTVSDMLASKMYGVKTPAAIVMEDGHVIGQYRIAGDPVLENTDYILEHVDRADKKNLINAMVNEGEMDFKISRDGLDSMGCLKKIDGTSWFLIQISPHEALTVVNKSTRNEAALILTILFVVYSVSVVTTITFNIKVARSELKKKVSKEKEKTELELKIIAAAAKTIYPFICTNNLTKDVARVEYNDTGIGDIEVNMSVNEYVKQVSETFADEDYKKEFLTNHSRENLQKLYQEGEKLIYGRVKQLYPDGIKWMEYRTIFVESESKDIYAVSMGRNIDPKVARETELQETSKKAEAANRAKSMFLFNMSHDIRTPMNAVLGYAELANRHLDNIDKVEEYLANITSAGENLLEIINNVLEMARIENNKLVITEDVYDLSKLPKQMNSLFAQEAEKKHVDFKVESNIYHSQVLVDHVKLNKILINIVSNAVKYTPQGGLVKLVVSQKPAEDVDHCSINIVCEDTGIGMSKEFQRHMFDNFSRERATTNSGIQGTGLGLSIVKGTVDALNGTVHVDSNTGEGTRFEVDIPCRVSYDEDTMKVVSSQNKDLFVGKHVLLVEDNDLNAEIAKEILKEEGLVVDRAINGKECIDILEKAEGLKYDVILMDIQMPIMDGYEATKLIRQMSDENKANIPIIAMTANAFDEDRQNAYNAGMNGHIAKPINIEQLFNTLAGSI